MDACSRLKRPILKDLYVSGDKGWVRSKVGAIKGICRISVPTRNYIYDDIIDPKTGNITKKLRTTINERGEQIAEYEIGSVEQDCFRVKAGLFEEDLIIRVSPQDHTQMIGDVTLFGYSLIPISEYFFLNTDHLDVRQIDFAILKEAERTVAFVTMTDMKEIVDKATGIDARHKKGIEAKSLVEVPETRQVGQPQTPY